MNRLHFMIILDEINKYAAPRDKYVLVWLLERYHRESEWRFVATCHHQHYGTESYKTNRVWEPTEEGLVLYNHRNELSR